MEEKNRHLATFQNLCIIASADGALDYREKNLLYELAESMGLEQEVIAHLIQQAKKENLQFQLPTTEEDRLMELKLGVLMILADEKIEPEEYHACKQFATDMGISVQMLDETIAYYQERQQEQKYHVGIFQNLFMMALADGQITEEEQQLLLEIAQHLGIQQSDIDRLLDHHEELDLIIPPSEEDQYFSLKNLVYMMVVDGNIDPKEYALCKAFAEQIGKDVQDIEAIISEYQQMQVERKGSAKEFDSRTPKCL
ncbi:MAG: TerB family tellurite resistance protein, partial [Bacteroidota bacterium]